VAIFLPDLPSFFAPTSHTKLGTLRNLGKLLWAGVLTWDNNSSGPKNRRRTYGKPTPPNDIHPSCGVSLICHIAYLHTHSQLYLQNTVYPPQNLTNLTRDRPTLPKVHKTAFAVPQPASSSLPRQITTTAMKITQVLHLPTSPPNILQTNPPPALHLPHQIPPRQVFHATLPIQDPHH